MNPQPLVIRELQVALRRPWTYSLRKWFGAGAMGVTVWGFLIWTGTSSWAGETIFQSLTYSAALAAMIAGIFLTSDSISREKREGTLGFLFLTDLYAPDVILGKLAAAGIVPASMLIAMFPGFAMCQLVGGVTFGEFWRTMLALVITLFVVLTATLYISSRCVSHRQSYGWATLLLLIVNPLALCWTAFDANYSRAPIDYWGLAALFNLLAITFLYRACAVVDSSWRDPEAIGGSNSVPSADPFSTRLLVHQPIAWLMLRRRPLHLTLRFMFRGRALKLALKYLPLLGLALLYALFIPWLFDAKGTPWVLGALFFVHLACELVLLTRTAYSFFADRQDGSLELLLATRLETEEIFDGFNSYLLLHSSKILWLLTGIDALTSSLLFLQGHFVWSAFPLAMAATLWITIFGLGWLGVFRSLMTNHPLRAMFATFFRLSFFPLLLSLLLLSAPRTDILKVLVFWIASTGGVALFFGMDAKSALLRHGRSLLLRPYNESPPHIENELSFINWDDAIEPASQVPGLTMQNHPASAA